MCTLIFWKFCFGVDCCWNIPPNQTPPHKRNKHRHSWIFMQQEVRFSSEVTRDFIQRIPHIPLHFKRLRFSKLNTLKCASDLCTCMIATQKSYYFRVWKRTIFYVTKEARTNNKRHPYGGTNHSIQLSEHFCSVHFLGLGATFCGRIVNISRLIHLHPPPPPSFLFWAF